MLIYNATNRPLIRYIKMDNEKDENNVLDTNGYNGKKNSDSSSTKVIMYQEESSISSNESGGESNEVYLLLLVCYKGKEHKTFGVQY